MGNFWSTHVELHFCPLWHGRVCSVHVEMHFVSSLVCSLRVRMQIVCTLAWVVFGQPKLRYLSSPAWVFSKLVGLHFVSHLACERSVNTGSDTFYFSSLTLERVAQQKLRLISCPRWHVWCLVNKLCVLSGMEGVWSTHVEINFMCSLFWERIGQRFLS